MLDLLAALDPDLVFPVREIPEVSWLHAVLSHPVVKSLSPLPLMVALAPLIYLFLRRSWRELDAEARLLREADGATPDYRPVACLVIVAVVLTLQEYYGGRQFYDQVLRPWLTDLESGHPWLKLKKYDEFYGYCWWSFSRVFGYVFIPFTAWKFLFPKDSLLDMGLRTRGVLKHAWMYGVLLLIVIPPVFFAATMGDFGSYYPFYKLASRSWWDFLAWEAIYFAQFFALEMFFRGFIVGALRRLGFAAVFVMAVPYCMIHYGKPYMEAQGAIIAGVVLGSLAMWTRSVYGGVLVHISVAFLMDFLALLRRSALPHSFWSGG